MVRISSLLFKLEITLSRFQTCRRLPINGQNGPTGSKEVVQMGLLENGVMGGVATGLAPDEELEGLRFIGVR